MSLTKKYVTLSTLLSTTLVVFLAQCTGTIDPGEAGLIDGIRNQVDGTYTETIEQKRAERSGLEDANALLEEDVAALSVEEAENSRKLAAANSRLSTLRGRVANLRRKYEGDRTRYGTELKKLSNVETQLDQEGTRLVRVAQTGSTADSSLKSLSKIANIVSGMPK